MEKRIRYALIIFAGLLAALLIILFFQYRTLQRQQFVGMRQLRAAIFLEHHAPLPAADANAVRSWMTFDYINRLFALPPNYLRTQLGVTASSSYPRMTISNYAKSENASSTVLLDEIENAIRNFSPTTSLPTSTSPSPPSART
jgi:hypothetical protein